MVRPTSIMLALTFLLGASFGAVAMHVISVSRTQSVDLTHLEHTITMPSNVALNTEDNKTSITVPPSRNPTVVVLEKKPLPVNRKAPTFNQVMAEMQCEGKIGAALKACLEKLDRCKQRTGDWKKCGSLP